GGGLWREPRKRKVGGREKETKAIGNTACLAWLPHFNSKNKNKDYHNYEEGRNTRSGLWKRHHHTHTPHLSLDFGGELLLPALKLQLYRRSTLGLLCPWLGQI
ncbi:hypothetical protein AKJ16_DCAP12797, partial [Drosera capensis]